MKTLNLLAVLGSTFLIAACSESTSEAPVSIDTSSTASPNQPSESSTRNELADSVRSLIVGQSGGRGLDAFILPDSDDYYRIPQDPANPLTDAKVTLGKFLFHDTAFALNGVSNEHGTWSCATCHHAGAGFKSGTRQGIAEGGTGFGINGSDRRLANGFNASSESLPEQKPDLQPLASPTILNSAYQDVMLWNGQFGNSPAGVINVGVDHARLMTRDTPKAVNAEGLSGVETQAVAGSGVHRLNFEVDTPLQNNREYQRLWQAAYSGASTDIQRDAALAIAAYERTVLANRAPFQRWLRGDENALNEIDLQGAEVFFGKGGCVDCHRGAGLGSDVGSTGDETFFAVGFNDLDQGGHTIEGTVGDADRLGRGGFTGNPLENHRFKIPQLYNLLDANVFGHGASFSSVREVIEYKNAAVAQNSDAADSLDPRFVPLELTASEIDALTRFVENALNDPELARYQPSSVPSGQCVVVDSHDDSIAAFCAQAAD